MWYGENSDLEEEADGMSSKPIVRDARRSTRVPLRVVIEAQGITEPLTCEGETIVVNLHGAFISTAIPLSKGMRIKIEVNLTGKRANAEVVYVDSERPLHCGIALAKPANIWGVSLPPDDWYEGVVNPDIWSASSAIHPHFRFSDSNAWRLRKLCWAHLRFAFGPVRSVLARADYPTKVDQLFNSREKRLAGVLLLLAHFGKKGKPEAMISRISQELSGEVVGTTRSRVSSGNLSTVERDMLSGW
jgi:hypothetical protein